MLIIIWLVIKFIIFILNRAQDFYHRNLFAMFTGKLYGLIAVLSVPSILKILIHTRNSSNSCKAYKRYIATIFHTISWYENELKPGSR